MTDTTAHASEVARGERFGFGENWSNFISSLDDGRVAEARRSLQSMLDVDSLAGLTILDIGCGSGLFSLAAVQLGAARVHSVDFDPASVECARELKRRYAPGGDWTIEEGSALDRGFLESLGQFDLVYAWGVLHHTGDMYTALDNAAIPVSPDGRLFLSIYNDRAWRSDLWRKIKRTYNILPARLRTPFVVIVMAVPELRTVLKALVTLKPRSYIQTWTQRKRSRGMSRWHDWIDWCGGYPFEVAKPEQIFEFYRDRGFELQRLRTTDGNGCNEFVFGRDE